VVPADALAGLVVAGAVVHVSVAIWVWLLIVIAALVIQLTFVRPPRTRRSNRVLAGEECPRSHAHLWYVGLEVIKVVTLIGLALAAAP
jgi:hypothetical protein